MFGWFSRKKEVGQLKEDTKKGFDSVKSDITNISTWIKHLDSEKDLQKKELESIKDILSTVEEEMEGLKNVFAMMNELKPSKKNRLSKQVFNKQPPVYAVQTGVQTGVQTPNLEQFSITERAILWILLNTDMKLSYQDIATLLGKERSTIRGQINSIRQKSENLIKEVVEENGKKRVYIPEEIREKMLKKTKVRVKRGKKSEKK